MLLKSFKEGISHILFPKVCTVCGLKLSSQEQFVCNHCLNDKFELAYREGKQSSSGAILPEGIILQHALWNFDKGGYLQELLHQLKYHRLTGVGEDLGRQLGKSLLMNPFFVQAIKQNKVRLLPVPLHPKKRRMRGYNQAFHIAHGIAKVTKLHILSKDAVKRIKNTSTQTGFSLEKRRKNIEGAFEVGHKDAVKNCLIILVDDVFTTGSTTFELASELKKSGCNQMIIATVAQA
ncbi:ComF family protein [Gracilimonas sp.]|uniref:ComF family protein n=1 Tax=Gracilimonas sp. TaxID=1974203 RepID=UPI002870D1FC|nr:ComF family protein [Gracilimonas sp.]